LSEVPSDLTVTGEPSLVSITPESGSTNGGTIVTIIGNAFTNQTVVKIRNIICNLTKVEINKLTCITNANMYGNYSPSIR
jgi:hypothetical protein